MAIDTKYGEVTTEKGEIRDDEPVFVLRGQDKLARAAIQAYRERVIEEMRESRIGADEGAGLVEAVDEAIDQFDAYADAKPDLMKLPD